MKPATRTWFACGVSALLLPALLAEPTQSLTGKKILFVTGADSPARVTDDHIRGHLQSLGCVVTAVEQAVAPARAAGQDLILVSATVDEGFPAAIFKDVAVPLITCESGALADLGMTGRERGRDFGTTTKPDTYLSITNASHPLAAGLPAGIFVATGTSVPMNWGKPGPAASIIVTPPGYLETPVVFAYEKGATLASGSPAPARRVSFFLHDEAFDRLEASAGGRQAQGLALFEAAVRWAVSRPVLEPVPAAPGKKLLLVTLQVSPNPKPEVRAAVARTNAAMLQHLAKLGFAVTVADESDPASRAEGQDLVVIMATIRANRLLGRFQHVTVPVVNLENDILDNMGMTAKRRWVDFGEVEQQRGVELVNAPHPLAAGLPAGPIRLFQEDATVGFGLPGAGAAVIATVAGQPDKAACFAYEKGATMDYDFTAPARRVYFPIDFDAFDRLSESGLKIFDATLFWAAGASHD
jgi:hypothetical protein